MTVYRFLFDNDAKSAKDFFPAKRGKQLSDAGLPDSASDDQVVLAAARNKWIVVTCNGDDYLQEFRAYLKRTKKSECHDLNGLVIIPSGIEIQRKCLGGLTEKLRLDDKAISWEDVWNLDCCVRVNANGRPTVFRFERCFYCKKLGSS